MEVKDKKKYRMMPLEVLTKKFVARVIFFIFRFGYLKIRPCWRNLDKRFVFRTSKSFGDTEFGL